MIMNDRLTFVSLSNGFCVAICHINDNDCSQPTLSCVSSICFRKELRVPKSLRVQLKLQNEFRTKANDMLRQPLSATVLPVKLGRYFSLNENIP